MDRARCETQLYIASCVPEGGIYRYALRGDGAVFIDRTPLDSPMYFVADGGRLYVLLRAPFPGSERSGLIVFTIRPDGSLAGAGDIVPTDGVCACHLAVCGGDVYVANYLSGSVGIAGGKTVVHTGRGVNAARQDAAHAHAVVLSPDGSRVLAADLGLDTIFVFDRALNELGSARVPDGYGVRHLLFDPSGRILYAVNELKASVSVFSWDGERLRYLHTVPGRFAGDSRNTGAAIRLSPDGQYLYISNRGGDTVERFAVSGADVVRTDDFPCGGKDPRDFVLTPDGSRLVVCNQSSDNVAILRADDGRVLFNIAVRAPLCALVR